MRTATGLLLLTLALMLGMLELMALADPALARLEDDGNPFGPPEPWYVHAGWIAGVCLMLAASAWLLSGGIVGRLVWGRGLTPAPRGR